MQRAHPRPGKKKIPPAPNLPPRASPVSGRRKRRCLDGERVLTVLKAPRWTLAHVKCLRSYPRYRDDNKSCWKPCCHRNLGQRGSRCPAVPPPATNSMILGADTSGDASLHPAGQRCPQARGSTKKVLYSPQQHPWDTGGGPVPPHPLAGPVGHLLFWPHSLPTSPAPAVALGGIPGAQGFPGCTHRVTLLPKSTPKCKASHEAAQHHQPFLPPLWGTTTHPITHQPIPSPPKTPSNPTTSVERWDTARARPPPCP